jgi:hypothetical protein
MSQPLCTPVELRIASSIRSLLVQQIPRCEVCADAHRLHQSTRSSESQAGPKRLWDKEMACETAWELCHLTGVF